MRVLAVARFRLLKTIRVAHPVFAVAFVAAALPLIVGSEAFTPAYAFWSDAQTLMWSAALTVQVAFALHLIVILSACATFGMRRRAAGGQDLLDLTETVPVTPADRFVGDAAGILGSVLAVHLCVLPILTLAVILSPLPTATFLWMESMTLLIAVLVSAAASWNLHVTGRWRNTQVARSVAIFIALLVVVLRLTTHWQRFADAAWFYFVQPSRQTWTAVANTITSPMTLLACMILLYTGFIGYYAVQSVRCLDRR